MVSSLDELGALLQEINLTPADVAYIVNFMKDEKISPQLAMRRIKAFDTLKEKLENNEDKKRIKQLEEELKQVKNQLLETKTELDNLVNQKSGLETEKQELETKSELLDSEREELQRQLELLRDMQLEDDEPEELKVLEDFIERLKKIEEENEFSDIIRPINEVLVKITHNEPWEFDTSEYASDLSELLSAKLSEQSKETETAPSTQPDETASIAKIKDKAGITEKEKSASEKKIEDKPEKKKEKSKPEKKVSEKEEQVINLFLEFITEAETDKGFQERVSTICDMDEAYQYLGSIGLSQVYSFSSRGIDKKEELIQLLNSWKEEGVPR